jgi:hypothetical protein
MFTGLAAAISYDNLANLLAAGTLLAFTRFRRDRSPRALLAFFALIFAGCLAKRTFLPLAFLFVVLLVVRETLRERAWLAALPGRFAALFRPARASMLALLGVAVVLGLFVASLYGGNVLEYGRLRPDFDQIVGHENAMNNRVYARAYIVSRYQRGELTFEQAEELAQQIRHRGDRSDTLVLLRSATRPESTIVGPVGYASQWMQSMLRSTVGYLGHRRAFRDRAATVAYVLVFLVSGALLVRKWRPSQHGGAPTDALFLGVGYASIVMWLVNYPTYLEFKNVELAVQGRYLFLLIAPIQGLVAYYLLDPLPVRARPWVAAAVAVLFISGDVPWLLSQLSDRWLLAPEA